MRQPWQSGGADIILFLCLVLGMGAVGMLVVIVGLIAWVAP